MKGAEERHVRTDTQTACPQAHARTCPGGRRARTQARAEWPWHRVTTPYPSTQSPFRGLAQGDSRSQSSVLRSGACEHGGASRARRKRLHDTQTDGEWVCERAVRTGLATSVCRLRHDQMEQGPTEPHTGRGTFLLSSGGAGGRVLPSSR